MRRRQSTSKAYTKREPVKYKKLLCERCGAVNVKVDEVVKAVTCHVCCAHMGPQVITAAAKVAAEGPKRPKGWRFMNEYVDEEGNVFNKGVEKPELKGTLTATVIVPKEKKSTFHKEQEKAAKEEKLAKKFARKQEKLKKAEIKKEKEKSTNEEIIV